MPFPADQRHSPWLAVAGMCGVYLTFGLALGVMAPLVDEISTDLDLSRSVMGSILGAWALIYIFTAVPAGAVVDRLGLRWSMTLGGLSIASSLLLRSLAGGALSMFGAVAVFGIGGPLVSIATPKLIASLFDEDDRRLPTGFGVAAPTIGSALAFAFTDPVLLPLTNERWRLLLAMLGGVALIATAAWLYASRAVAHLQPGETQTDVSTLRRLLGLRSMRLILTISLCSFFISHGLNGWLPEILANAGWSESAAGYLSAMSLTVGIMGALTIARLAPAARRGHALATIYSVVAVSVSLLSVAPLGLVVAALAFMGFARAGIIPMLFLEIMGDPDIDIGDIGAATGLFFAVGQIGGFAGPYAVGFIADLTDGFTAATLLLSAAAVTAALTSLALQRAQRP